MENATDQGAGCYVSRLSNTPNKRLNRQRTIICLAKLYHKFHEEGKKKVKICVFTQQVMQVKREKERGREGGSEGERERERERYSNWRQTTMWVLRVISHILL